MSADFYRGDLLQKVLKIDSRFWNEYPDLHFEVDSIVLEVKQTFEGLQSLLDTYKPLSET
ncbi:hypothetical protein [Baia soyae]|uniref:hypothetical protein n=1 Tax=Baia soyae TaxID=1544746 RepID=UPI00104DF71C|nr:hypothetical protein [Baia soyae]